MVEAWKKIHEQSKKNRNKPPPNPASKTSHGHGQPAEKSTVDGDCVVEDAPLDTTTSGSKESEGLPSNGGEYQAKVEDVPLTTCYT